MKMELILKMTIAEPVKWSNGTHDIIIRFNHIYDNYQANIVAQSCTYNLYIYGNRLHESNWGGIYGKEGAGGAAHPLHDIYIWSNIIFKEEDSGSRFHVDSGGTTEDHYNIYWYNNTFAENATDGAHTSYNMGQIYIQSGLDPGSFGVKNNIFYKSRPGYASNQERQNYFADGITDKSMIDYNLYHWPAKTSQIYSGGESGNAIGGRFVGIEN